jgi:GMP synthase (glutamine-hydrolysing)
MTFDDRQDETTQPGAQASRATTELSRPSRKPRKPVLIIMHGEQSSAGRIGMSLVARGYRLDLRKPRFGCPLPTSLENYSGALIFGGPMSCNDCDDYIRAEIDFVGIALKEQRPFLGVCLGAQMLAKHLGAAVGPHPEARVEIGYHDLEATEVGAKIGPWPAKVYHWHNEGFALPTGGTCLATSRCFPNQAFSYAKAALGIQFHPEITYSLVNRWTVKAGPWQQKPGAQPRLEQLESHVLHAPRVHAWLERILDLWLEADLPVTASA